MFDFVPHARILQGRSSFRPEDPPPPRGWADAGSSLKTHRGYAVALEVLRRLLGDAGR